MQAHTIVIVVIFCAVCLLLLLAFFYTFCFHCSIMLTSTDSHSGGRSSPDREDATFK
uniref:Si:ch73-208h1.4 n=1 Tax=Hippocampus comes TaxID=109280 RepID=A0A3Q2Y655_HIPCM